ncbi:hypothetical protein KIPB_013146 [Kipferlia bialata]|uniref:Uncharacterized protein n=1 Tax=Kipferlia bialata TaxID=797122 RepID=A0A391NRT2_9EUKA|nr:hypothetical protein KIPB_013146 [Kipferlia bialata]|eukprot:g13146.t1
MSADVARRPTCRMPALIENIHQYGVISGWPRSLEEYWHNHSEVDSVGDRWMAYCDRRHFRGWCWDH